MANCETLKNGPMFFPFIVLDPACRTNSIHPSNLTCPLTRHHFKKKHTHVDFQLPTIMLEGQNLLVLQRKACLLPLFTVLNFHQIFHLSTVSCPTFTYHLCSTSHTLTRSITLCAASTSGTSASAAFGGSAAGSIGVKLMRVYVGIMLNL